MGDTAISDLLRGEGYVAPASVASARAVLEGAGLTRPGKERMADEKLDRARDALSRELIRHCSDPACIAEVAGDGRQAVETDRASCSICSGSNNTRALRGMAAACATSRVRRVLIVGGRPPMWSEMERTLRATSLQLRFVDGTSKLPTGADALRDCAWADLLVVWAPTPLPHKVSGLYRPEVCTVPRRVVVHRRGIEALAMEVVEHLSR
ncbi:MAG TPA: hypothetical protein VFH90_00010 [Candidatus Limnocylindria bacterium]|nr:hypothetical protein [Candidatus Limnocylindria bacterium]